MNGKLYYYYYKDGKPVIFDIWEYRGSSGDKNFKGEDYSTILRKYQDLGIANIAHSTDPDMSVWDDWYR